MSKIAHDPSSVNLNESEGAGGMQNNSVACSEEILTCPPHLMPSRSRPAARTPLHGDMNKCRDCGVHEGEFHVPGCGLEACPFCGGQLLSCGCQFRHFYPTYVHDHNTTVPFNGLPEAVYKNGLSKKQFEEWENVLQTKGLIPHVLYPNLCCKCGALWPEMFRVPDDEWKRYVAPSQRSKMLCRSCYNGIKSTIDRAQRASWIHRFCESPIEEKLIDGFLEIGFIAVEKEEASAERFGLVAIEIRRLIAVTQQNEVEVGGKTYRVDFAIRSVDEPDIPLIIVEADGHDYHERSKNDARRDRSRDRAFLSIGIPTVRFTGSEIHANPARCAREAVDLAINSAPPHKQDLILQAAERYARTGMQRLA